MRPIRNFEEFIKENIVKKQSVDSSRAEFLIKESNNAYNNLLDMTSKLGLKDDNANTFIKLCYDIIMEMIRAKMLLEGYNSSGFNAHEAEVSYLRVLGFEEKEVQFVNQLRYFRNGMVYYGKILDSEYAQKVIYFVERIYPKLKKVIQ